MNRKQFVMAMGLCLASLIVVSSAANAGGNGWNHFWQQQHAKQRTAAHAAAKSKRLAHNLTHHHKSKFDPATQALRMRMFAGKPMTEAQLKLLADKGESLAAFRLAKLLQTKEGSAEIALRYFAKAALAGRRMAAEPMLALLRAPESSFTQASLTAAKSGLLAAIGKGDTKAMTGLAQLYLAGKPLGGDRTAAVELLILAAKHGDESAALEAGVLLTEPGAGPGDNARATEMFKIAAKHGNLIAMSKLEGLVAQ